MPGFGYVNKTPDDQVQLRFEKRPSKRLKALCTRTSSTATEDLKDGNPGVAVGVSVSVAVIFIVIVIVLVILKRRGKYKNLCKEKVSTKDSDYSQSKRIMHKTMIDDSQANTSHGVINEACNTNVREEDDNNMINESQNYSVIEEAKTFENQNANDYFILEKSAEEIDQNVENVSLHNYFKLEKHERECNKVNTAYDTTRTETSSRVKDTGNVYNVLNENDSALDDHVYNTTQENAHQRDETYDTTEKALYKMKKADNCVNTENDVDTYHHTGEKPLNSIRSDNTYGIPDHLKVSKGDSRESGMMNQVDLDTYSHLNTNPTNITRTDNLYGVHKEIDSTRSNLDQDYDVMGNMTYPTTDDTYSKLETNY